MTESILIPKKWLKVGGFERTSRDLLEKIILVCSGKISLRIAADTNSLEALTGSQQDHDEAEAMIHQALADEILRQKIKTQSDQQINNLVDGILIKASTK